MFKYLTKGLLAVMAIHLLDNCRYLSVQVLKLEAAKCCLHGVRMARLSAIGLVRMGLAIGLVGVGVLFFHLGLFILLPLIPVAKAVIAMCLGLAYMAIGCYVLHRATDEKKWMKKSGVSEMLEEAIGQSSKDSRHGM